MKPEARASLPAVIEAQSILILGAAGFIGRWVSRLLCRTGARPYLAVRDVESAERIFSDYEINGEIIKADLQRLDSVSELIARIKPDIVFNLAGYGVDSSERNEATAYRINTRLIGAICNAMAKNSGSDWTGERVIHVGSALEYGEIGGNLAEDSVVNPTTLYGKSKLMGTNLLATRCREIGLKGITVRLFTVYGPGEHDGRLLPSLLKASGLKASGDNAAMPLTAGEQRRDFTYVEDVAEGLLRLAVAESQPGEIVNLATGQLITVRSFVETAASVLNISKNNLQFGAIPTRTEEMQHDNVSVDRLLRLTGWTPSTVITDGIQRTKNFEHTKSTQKTFRQDLQDSTR